MDVLPIIFIGLGLFCMAGLSGIASAIGCVIAGNAVVGAIKKRPEVFGPCLVTAALPSSHGLIGFVVFIMYQGVVKHDMGLFGAVIVFAAGLIFGCTTLFVAIKQAQVVSSGINAMGSGANTFAPTLILAVFPELYTILAFVITVMMQGLITK